jgi:hypothetical protein
MKANSLTTFPRPNPTSLGSKRRTATNVALLSTDEKHGRRVRANLENQERHTTCTHLQENQSL